MMTVRHIERLWRAQAYKKLLHEMLRGRAEASICLEDELAGPLPAAAAAIVRLDELTQAHVPLYDKLLRTILAAQDKDGGWVDPMNSAICLRALLASNGRGQAIERGLLYLSAMQKPEGIWPKVGFRRMPADPLVSAFILLQLGNQERFRRSVRFLDALNWFEWHEHTLHDGARRIWHHASIRCRVARAASGQATICWS
jgi:hypothetical protein